MNRLLSVFSLVAALFFLFKSTAPAQETVDVIYLKNGSVIKGSIVEQVPNVYLKIETKDGSIYVYKMEEIEKIVKEKETPPPGQTPPMQIQSRPSHIPAKAQSRTMVSLSGGISIPVAPDLFTDLWSSGINIGAGFGYFLDAHQRFALQGYLDYSSHPLDEDAVLKFFGASGASVSGLSLNILAMSMNFRASLGSADSKAVPYFIGGVGLSRQSAGDVHAGVGGQMVSEETSHLTESKIGLGLGAGLDLNLTEKVGIFLEAKYGIVLVTGEKTQYLPLKVGLFYR